MTPSAQKVLLLTWTIIPYRMHCMHSAIVELLSVANTHLVVTLLIALMPVPWLLIAHARIQNCDKFNDEVPAAMIAPLEYCLVNSKRLFGV